MNIISDLFSRHLAIVKRNPFLTVIIGLIFALVLYNYNKEGHPVHGIGYLAAMLICMYITDLWMMIFPTHAEYPEVKKPKHEIFIFILFTSLGLFVLVLRFVILTNWNTMPGLYKLAIVPFFLFVWPVYLALYFLVKKYSLKDLGLRFDKSILIALPIAAITGLTTWLVAPDNIHWTEMIKSEGVPQFLFEGFISAALSEEFLRYIGQTRLRFLFNNYAWAIFVTVCIWALMHAPKWYGESNGDIMDVLSGSARLIPLGIMWSYMIHRTKSILPSILVHATNLWGLQNP